jgi:hypothetical protein
MKKGTIGEARLHMNVAPEKLYALVSDVTRMGEWSPETVRCRWLEGATGPAVGARFKGSNRRGLIRWSTTPRVVAAEPGREFAFVVSLVLVNREMTKWSYRFQPAADGGTDVTESFEMMNDLPSYIALVERSLMRVKDRKTDLEAGMQRTLERIKTVAEGSA